MPHTGAVRKIIRIEARARRLLLRYERALATSTDAMAKARALLDDAYLLEEALTGTQLDELRHARAATLGIASPPTCDLPHPSATTASR